MRKIPTLFERDEFNRSHVKNRVNSECAWVINGEGVATRKYDGTCVMFDGERWWARREVKLCKPTPLNFESVSTDPVTGKVMGWEPIEQSSFAKFHAEALESGWRGEPGTYELCGPKINGDPEGFEEHVLISHELAERYPAPRDFESLRVWLLYRPRMEGLVWHHPDGRMAKIKRRDFA